MKLCLLLVFAFISLLALPLKAEEAIMTVQLSTKSIPADAPYVITLKDGEAVVKFKEEHRPYVEFIECNFDGTPVEVMVDDGRLTTLGGPEKHKEYPVIVRASVTEIKVRAPGKKNLSVRSLKLHTQARNYSSYGLLSHTQRQALTITNFADWADNIAHEFVVLSVGTPYAHDVFRRFIMPLKTAAMNAKYNKSTEPLRAQQFNKSIQEASLLFESDIMLLNSRYEVLARDLKSVKRDLERRYKLKR